MAKSGSSQNPRNSYQQLRKTMVFKGFYKEKLGIFLAGRGGLFLGGRGPGSRGDSGGRGSIFGGGRGEFPDLAICISGLFPFDLYDALYTVIQRHSKHC